MQIKILITGACGIIGATFTTMCIGLDITQPVCPGSMTCKTDADCFNGSCDRNGCCISGQVGNCSQSNCASTAWTAGGTGYETRIYRTCDISFVECISTTQYRCASGYYGTSSNGTSGCTRCPSSGGVYGTSAAGATAITSCYIPSGTSASDASGSYILTGDCYYNN